MLRISLAAIGIFVSTLAVFSQPAQDSLAYKNRKLKLEEVNFVSGYYQQNGNNSAVTGGMRWLKFHEDKIDLDRFQGPYSLFIQLQ